MKTIGKGKMGGGWGEDIKPCRICDLKDTPLQAVPRLGGRVWWGPTLSRRPGTRGKTAEPHVCTLVTSLMDSAPFGTYHVGNPSYALAENLEKMWL